MKTSAQKLNTILLYLNNTSNDIDFIQALKILTKGRTHVPFPQPPPLFATFKYHFSPNE